MRDNGHRDSLMEKVAPAVLLIMVCVWAIIAIGDMILTSYEANPLIHGIIPGAMALLLAIYSIKRNGNGKGA